jgi:sugar phosphate permease
VTASRSARAWLVWMSGVITYIVAVTHRTAFGVAGLDAADRFGVQETALSLFVVIQVLVYAGLQLPVGIALDRWGSRTIVTVGAITAGIGEVGMVLADAVPVALAARVLVGAGDAMTFVSVIRVIPAWFPARQVPVLVQLTGTIGQLGQVVAALPFAWTLHHHGWQPAFAALAAVSGIAAASTWFGLRDRPANAPVVARHGALVGLGETVRSSGTWLGFFAHLLSGFSINLFVLMWGYPFLVEGQGVSPATASALLTVSVVVTVAAGPLLGALTARFQRHRQRLVGGVAVMTLTGWLIVLLPATPRPTWQLVVFVVLITVGGPASLIGLDLAGSFAPPERLGTAIGVANGGAFISSLTLMLVVGLVLDVRTGAAPATLTDYRVALSSVIVMWVIGVVGVRATGARAAARLARPQVTV